MKIANRRTDCIKKTVKEELQGVHVVMLEDLKTFQIIRKGRGMRGRNRSVSYSAIGYTKAEIIRHCAKNGINVVYVSPYRTSMTCYPCGHVDKKSRDGEAFLCTSCKNHDHADLNAAANITDNGVSGAAGKAVIKQKDGMALKRYVSLKVTAQKERNNPDCFRFGSRGQAGRHCGLTEGHPSVVVPLLLDFGLKPWQISCCT